MFVGDFYWSLKSYVLVTKGFIFGNYFWSYKSNFLASLE